MAPELHSKPARPLDWPGLLWLPSRCIHSSESDWKFIGFLLRPVRSQPGASRGGDDSASAWADMKGYKYWHRQPRSQIQIYKTHKIASFISTFDFSPVSIPPSQPSHSSTDERLGPAWGHGLASWKVIICKLSPSLTRKIRKHSHALQYELWMYGNYLTLHWKIFWSDAAVENVNLMPKSSIKLQCKICPTNFIQFFPTSIQNSQQFKCHAWVLLKGQRTANTATVYWCAVCCLYLFLRFHPIFAEIFY